MADGTYKVIEDIAVGDIVWAQDPTTSESGGREVVQTIAGWGTKNLVEITTDSGSLVATEDHPIWVNNDGEWLPASEVQPGDYLLDSNGVTVLVESVSGSVAANATVHNLTIDGVHTFFVGAGRQAVLTHNASPWWGFPRLFASPALPRNPWSPGEVSKRQSDWRRHFKMTSIDPDTPIPDQKPGRNIKNVHKSKGRISHDGQRNIGAATEHSRTPKGKPFHGGRC